LPACLSRWQAVRAPQLAKRRRIHRRPRRSTRSFLVRRKSPTSIWRRSMSSIRKMLDHLCSSKNQGWPPDAVPAVPVASAVPTGRNLRSLQRQRSRHSIERRSLRTARAAFGTPDLSKAYTVPQSSPSKSNRCLLVATRSGHFMWCDGEQDSADSLVMARGETDRAGHQPALLLPTF
jgi:hypothetical protein